MGSMCTTRAYVRVVGATNQDLKHGSRPQIPRRFVLAAAAATRKKRLLVLLAPRFSQPFGAPTGLLKNFFRDLKLFRVSICKERIASANLMSITCGVSSGAIG